MTGVVLEQFDQTWEVFQLRQLKVDLMTAASHDGMAKVLSSYQDWMGATRQLSTQ